jgi:hypothetical protein
MRVKNIFCWSACLLLSFVQAKADGKKFTADWLDAALAGKGMSLPVAQTALSASDVKGEQTKFWNAYIEAAKRANWDKQLLPVPEPIKNEKGVR